MCTECRVACKLHGTQYTHHNMTHMLPQHCIIYNDVFLLINLLKPNDIYIYIYMSYRSANLQTIHFKYLFNKYTY